MWELVLDALQVTSASCLENFTTLLYFISHQILMQVYVCFHEAFMKPSCSLRKAIVYLKNYQTGLSITNKSIQTTVLFGTSLCRTLSTLKCLGIQNWHFGSLLVSCTSILYNSGRKKKKKKNCFKIFLFYRCQFWENRSIFMIQYLCKNLMIVQLNTFYNHLSHTPGRGCCSTLHCASSRSRSLAGFVCFLLCYLPAHYSLFQKSLG